MRRFSSDNTAPPPVASTIWGVLDHSSSKLCSRLRNPCFPSMSKLTDIRTPHSASISWSKSSNCQPNRRAKLRPMVDFPAPIMPTKKMGLGLPVLLPTCAELCLSFISVLSYLLTLVRIKIAFNEHYETHC